MGKTVLLLQLRIILSIKEIASSNLSSGMNSSSAIDELFGVSHSSSIVSSISIAYLYIEFINNFNFSLSSLMTLLCA